MRKIDGFDKMKAEGSEEVSFVSLPVGPQLCKIISVVDVPEKEYLKIEFDIADGEFANHFKDQFDRDDRADKKWPAGGTIYRSYKSTAYQFFTAFIIAVEKSNKGFIWNWDESDLEKKFFVGNFGEEEYISENELKVAMKCQEVRSTQALKEGKIKAKAKKTLPDSEKQNLSDQPEEKEGRTKTTSRKQQTPKIEVDEDDLPF